jgi:hypothetical protein
MRLEKMFVVSVRSLLLVEVSCVLGQRVYWAESSPLPRGKTGERGEFIISLT